MICQVIGLFLDALSVLDNTQGRVPELASIENEVGGVISDLFGDFFSVDLIVILSLVPVENNLVIDFKFRKIIEGIKMAEGVSPGEIAPAMSGKNSRYLILFWSAEVGYVPDTLFKEILPVFTLINFTSNPDRLNDKAVF